MKPYRMDLSGLKRLGQSLGVIQTARIQVGIFGSKTARGKGKAKGGDSLTNAEVGAIHEYGSFTRGIPMRSFLRMPLGTRGRNLPTEAASAPQGGRGASVRAAMVNDPRAFLERVAIGAVKIVLKAFATRGWGQWKPNTPGTIAAKGSDAPLIDTGQLRRAIAFRVVGV